MRRISWVFVLLVTLVLVGGNGRNAFGQEKQEGFTPPSFLGTHWRLAQLAGDPITRRSEIADLVFDLSYQRLDVAIGAMHVRDSCGNTYTGSYVIRGKSLEITPETATLVACLVGVSDVPRNPSLTRVFNYVSRFEVQGHTLVLRGKNGVPLARFDAAQ